MILPSKPAQYALRALCYIASREDGDVCQVSRISQSENIPTAYLSKVLKELAEKNILKSIKGPGGGFILGKKAEAISIYEVIAVYDNLDDKFKCCAIGWAQCSDNNPCPIHSEFKKVKELYSKYLRETNLSVFRETKQIKERLIC